MYHVTSSYSFAAGRLNLPCTFFLVPILDGIHPGVEPRFSLGLAAGLKPTRGHVCRVTIKRASRWLPRLPISGIEKLIVLASKTLDKTHVIFGYYRDCLQAKAYMVD